MTRQGFYAWKHRPPSKRDLADRELCERIRRVHAQTEGIYGSPRVDAGLRLTDGNPSWAQAWCTADATARVARGRRLAWRATHHRPESAATLSPGSRRPALCQGLAEPALGLRPQVHPDRARLPLPRRRRRRLQPPDHRPLDARQASRPSSYWTRLGWPPAREAPEAPALSRTPDHGSQYTSLLDGAYAKQSGIDLSTGSVGDPRDNALAETFPASLEKELLRRERLATREQARTRILWHIECLDNTKRRHSSLHYLTPTEYEQRHDQEATAA